MYHTHKKNISEALAELPDGLGLSQANNPSTSSLSGAKNVLNALYALWSSNRIPLVMFAGVLYIGYSVLSSQASKPEEMHTTQQAHVQSTSGSFKAAP